MTDRFETFTALITKINRNIKKIKNQEMADYDLRGTHISCLYYLYSNDLLTATELCERCEEDKATISRSLDYLEKNGYLTCQSKQAKRYNSRFTLTPKGLEAGKKIAEKINTALERISEGMSEEQRMEFYRCLTIISDGLDGLAKGIE